MSGMRQWWEAKNRIGIEESGKDERCWKEKVESRKGSVVEKVLTGEGIGKRSRGHPRKRWRDPF